MAIDILDTAERITKEASAFKLPKDAKTAKGLASCADLMYTARRDRLALSKAVDALEAREALLREHLIDNLSVNTTGIAGRVARASIGSKTIYTVKDWEAFYKYISTATKKDIGAWSLLQKRVGEAAVKEIFESGKKVPGIEPMDVKIVSLNKVG